MKGKDGRNLWRIDAGGTLIAAVLTATAYLAHISPTLSHHEQANARQIEFNFEQSKTRDLERSLNVAQDRVARVQKQAAGSQLQLQSIGELNQRLSRLTESAGDNRLQVDATESGTPVDQGRYGAVPIRIAGRGTYQTCQTALQKLHDAMPDIGVVGMDMDGLGVTTDPAVTFVFQLNWHTQPPAKPAAK